MPEKRRDHKGRVLRSGESVRADGRYMFRYCDLDGKRRSVYSWKLVSTDRIPAGRHDMPALRDMEKSILRDLDDGIGACDQSCETFGDFFEKFMDIRRDLKPSTRISYIDGYNEYIKKDLGFRRVKDIKFTELQRLYIRYAMENNLKKSSILKLHTIIFQVLEIAKKDRVIRENPAADAFKTLKGIDVQESEKRISLTEEQQTEFIEYIYRTPINQKMGPLFTVLLGTGLRIGEALGLRWCDCDFDQNLIIIDHALIYKPREVRTEDGLGIGRYEYAIMMPKTKAGIRTIPMLDEVRNALQEQKKSNEGVEDIRFSIGEYSDFIFLNKNGKPYTPSFVYSVLQRIVGDYNREEYFNARCEKRECHYLPHISAHILRHTFCTRLCENEQNLKVIQDVMGHTNIRTTMEVYSDATQKKKAASFDHLNGKFKLR